MYNNSLCTGVFKTITNKSHLPGKQYTHAYREAPEQCPLRTSYMEFLPCHETDKAIKFT